VKGLKNEISMLSLEFGKNLGEEKTELHFDEGELKGMEPGFFSTLKNVSQNRCMN